MTNVLIILGLVGIIFVSGCVQLEVLENITVNESTNVTEQNVTENEIISVPEIDILDIKKVEVGSGEQPSISLSNGIIFVIYKIGHPPKSIHTKLFDEDLNEIESFVSVNLEENFELSSTSVAGLSNGFLITYSERDTKNPKDEKLKGIILDVSGNIIKTIEIDQGIGDSTQTHHGEGGAGGGDADSEKNIFIVWGDTRNGPFQLFGRWFDLTGNPLGDDFRIDKGEIINPSIIWEERENTGLEQPFVFKPKVALNEFGEAFIVWTDERDQTQTPIKTNYFRIFRKDWSSDEDNIKLKSVFGSDHANVDFFEGNWIVVWKEDDNPLYGLDIEGEVDQEEMDRDKMENSNIKLFLNVYDRNGTLVKERIRVDTADKVYIGRSMGFVEKMPSIKSGENGFMVSWTDYRNGKPQVFARSFNRDFVPGNEVLIGDGWKPGLDGNEDIYFLSYQGEFDEIFLVKIDVGEMEATS